MSRERKARDRAARAKADEKPRPQFWWVKEGVRRAGSWVGYNKGREIQRRVRQRAQA